MHYQPLLYISNGQEMAMLKNDVKDKVHEWQKSALYQKLMKFGHKIDVGLLRSKMHF